MNAQTAPVPAPGGQVKMTWFESNQKNKQQGNSVSGGMMLMLVGGLHISYGIFNVDIFASYNQSVIKSSWYVGVILAGIAAHFLIDKWEKKILYYIGAVFCAAGSIMFFEPMSNYEELIILGRFVAGLGHGIVYMPLVIHSGENSVKEQRGMLLSSINYFIMISVATASVFNLMINSIGSMETIISPKLFVGILGLVYSAMTFIFIPLMFYESPVFLIRKNRESEALVNMIKMRGEQTESWQVRTDFEDLKQMIAEDNQTSSNIFNDNNIRPLIFVTLSKLLHSMSFNYPLNLIRLILVIISFFVSSNGMFWIPIALIISRITFGMIPLFGMDKVGRKHLLSVSAVLCGFSLIILGILFQIYDALYLITLVTFFLLFDLFSALGIGMVPDVLSSEAFPITKKSLSITFANTIDDLFNIILIIVTPNVWSTSFIYFVLFGFGSVLMAGAAFFYLFLPETRQMSLRQSRDVFRGTTSQQMPQVQARYNI